MRFIHESIPGRGLTKKEHAEWAALESQWYSTLPKALQKDPFHAAYVFAHLETIQMIDCSKDPNHVAEVLNDLL